MTTSRPNIDQLSFRIENSHWLKNFRGSICGNNLSFGIERVAAAAAAAQNLGCSGCEGGILGCCLRENGGGEGGGEVRGGGEEEDGEEDGWCCVVFHLVVRRCSSFVRPRGKSGRNLNPPYLVGKTSQKRIQNETKQAARKKKAQASKQADRPYLIHTNT